MDNWSTRGILFVSVLLCAKASAQNNIPTNSFADSYRQQFPALKYSYSNVTQTHDYSGNWDIDGDGKKDSVLFIGNGGVHLYFHLRLVLTGDHKVYDYPWLESDMPVLGKVSELKHHCYGPVPHLLVCDINGDGKDDIFLSMDASTAIPTKWKMHGVTSRNVVVAYRGRDVSIKDYKEELMREK